MERNQLYSRFMLTLIAILLGVIASRPFLQPAPVSAETTNTSWYVEPGTTTIRNPNGSRQVDGKVVIDLRNGDIWGYPVTAPLPYPVDVGHSEPPVVQPMYLGKFDFAKMTR